MCFGDDSRAPLPPVRGGTGDSDDLVLTSTDGTPFGALGTDAEVRVYPDAVHSFFDRRFDQYREECDDAWRRMLDFIGGHGGT